MDKINAEKLKVIAKKNWKYILTAVLAFSIGAITGPSTEDVDAANEETQVQKNKLEQVVNTKNNLVAEKKELQTKVDELQAKVDEAAPWFKMTDEEKKKTEAEAKAAEEKRLAEEKAKKEAEEKAKKEAEEKAKAEAEAKEKQGYNTGITYDQLARTPDDYIAEKVKFKGKVLQVMEGDGYTAIRLAVNGDYDNVIYGQYTSDAVNSRVLEDDTITIYGTSTGLFTYQSTMGGQISIPGVMIDKIDQ